MTKAEKMAAEQAAAAAEQAAAAAEQAAAAAEQAEEPEIVPTRFDPNEKTRVKLFKDGGIYKYDVDVAINGKHMRIKRGINVSIPRNFAEVLDQSEHQDAMTGEMAEAQADDYANNARSHGYF